MSALISTQPQRSGLRQDRDTYIDFLRGAVIVDMFLIHYARFFWPPIGLLLNYLDIAMDGFLLLSGFVTAQHFVSRFAREPSETTNRLLGRACKLLIVQYILVLLVSYPHFLLVTSHSDDPAGLLFLRQSFLFENQVGLLHILPLFVLTSAMSPALLWMARRRWESYALIASAAAFWIAQLSPGLRGDAVFPFLLWQIYFVLGFWCGALYSRNDHSLPISLKAFHITAWSLLGLAVVLKHSRHAGLFIQEVAPFLDVNRFPLSVGGLINGLALVSIALSLTAASWTYLASTRLVSTLSAFGRNSLLLFAIHVCFAKAADVIFLRLNASVLLVYALIVVNFIVSYRVACHFDRQQTLSTRPLKALHLLFR